MRPLGFESASGRQRPLRRYIEKIVGAASATQEDLDSRVPGFVITLHLSLGNSLFLQVITPEKIHFSHFPPKHPYNATTPGVEPTTPTVP
ncbi:hypothetical protein, partial [Arthrobacter sp. A2-55]|uniref:hypothetical protein n=1 Tax=Arthrobacter sp. A2-55 TaxID=2897337 RepID=UPI0021CD6F7D